MVIHSTLIGADLHYPLGHSTAGVLTLAASNASAYRINDSAGNALLRIDTSTAPDRILFGDATSLPDARFNCTNVFLGDTGLTTYFSQNMPANAANTFRIYDANATDSYIAVSTSTAQRVINFGYTGADIDYRFNGSGMLVLPSRATTMDATGALIQRAVTRTELFYFDGTSEVQITLNGAVNAAGGGGTLDAAYDFGGAGAGRTITVSDGAVELTRADVADTTYSLELTWGAAAFTGTPHGIRVNMAGATSLSNAADVYGVRLDGETNAGAGNSVGLSIGTGWDVAAAFGSGEFRDSTGSAGTATWVWTSNGSGAAPSWQAAAGGGGSLNTAYDFGGAGAGRVIDADDGAVEINRTDVGDTTYGLHLSYDAVAFTGTPHGILIDLSPATSLNNAGNVYGIRLVGETNAGAGNSVGLSIGTGWDVAVDVTGSITISGDVDGVDVSAHDHTGTGNLGTKLDHGAALTGLTDDDHTQYALLAGRSGGQILNGGITAGETFTIRASTSATGTTLLFDATAQFDFQIADNADNVWRVRQGTGTDNYIVIDTTNTTEIIEFGNATTNPDFRFFGSGEFRDSTGSAGTAGWAWTSNGAGAAPSWQAPGGVEPDTGTDNLTWTINQDGTAGSNQDPICILEGGDGGTELISTYLLQDSSADTVYLWTASGSGDADTSDRSFALTLGPLTDFSATTIEADVSLRLRGHTNGDAVGTFRQLDLVWDSSARNLTIGNATAAALEVNIGGEGSTTSRVTTLGIHAGDGTTARVWDITAQTAGSLLFGTISSGSNATSTLSIDIGTGLTVGTNINNRTAIGVNAVCSVADSVAVGRAAECSSSGTCVAVGSIAIARANGTCVGYDSWALSSGVAIGTSARAGSANSIVLGRGADDSAANQFMVGSSTYYVTDAIIGGGNTDANARTLTLRPSDGSGTAAGWALSMRAGNAIGTSGAGGALSLSAGTSIGTNIAGANVTYVAGRSTGNAAGGAHIFQGSVAGGSGAALNALFSILTVDPDVISYTPGWISGDGHEYIVCTPTNVSTTNATATTLLDFNVSGLGDGAYWVEANVCAKRGAANEAYGSTRFAVYSRDAGTLTVAGTGAQEPGLDVGAHANGISFTTSGDLIRVQVTGAAAETWEWSGGMKIRFVRDN